GCERRADQRAAHLVTTSCRYKTRGCALHPVAWHAAYDGVACGGVGCANQGHARDSRACDLQSYRRHLYPCRRYPEETGCITDHAVRHRGLTDTRLEIA